MTDNMRKFVRGLMVSTVSKGVMPPKSEKEPIAYLYNGVRLPKLPEWDKKAYPYATIMKNLGIIGEDRAGRYLIRCLSADAVTENGVLSSTTGLQSFASEDGTEWEPFKDITYVERDDNINNPVIPFINIFYPLVWTNFNAEYGGTTYMTASEPVPVYE